MIHHRIWLPAIACALAIGAVHAADERGSGKGREATRANATKKDAPSGTATTDLKPPLQTGEVQVPEGGVDTSRFDPNAGEGFKGRSSAGGGVIVPRDAASGATGGTQGAPLSGSTAPRGPRDAGPASAGRGERGSGTGATNSGDTRTGGGKNSAGSGFR